MTSPNQPSCGRYKGAGGWVIEPFVLSIRVGVARLRSPEPCPHLASLREIEPLVLGSPLQGGDQAGGIAFLMPLAPLCGGRPAFAHFAGYRGRSRERLGWRLSLRPGGQPAGYRQDGHAASRGKLV